jgi:cytochrome P450
MDDPEHARLRRMVTAPFSVERVEALRPAIQKIVDGLIDDMLTGPTPVDLVQAFALPVPSLVISELLGVPCADHDFFQRNSRLLVNRDAPPEEVLAAHRRLIDYLDRLIAEKLADPGGDLLSQLAVQRVATGQLSRHEAAQIGRLLLVAGHETTANMIALGTLALLQHPDQLAELRKTEDPKLIAGAVEELLCYLNIVHSGRRRMALENIEIDGQTIRAGEGVILANDIGNRDTTAFTDPDRLDIHRDARRVFIDQDKCIASGQCVLAAADVFDQRDEDGVVVLLNPDPPAELADDVRQAAAVCPALAIRVEEE